MFQKMKLHLKNLLILLSMESVNALANLNVFKHLSIRLGRWTDRLTESRTDQIGQPHFMHME